MKTKRPSFDLPSHEELAPHLIAAQTKMKEEHEELLKRKHSLPLIIPIDPRVSQAIDELDFHSLKKLHQEGAKTGALDYQFFSKILIAHKNQDESLAKNFSVLVQNPNFISIPSLSTDDYFFAPSILNFLQEYHLPETRRFWLSLYLQEIHIVDDLKRMEGYILNSSELIDLTLKDYCSNLDTALWSNLYDELEATADQHYLEQKTQKIHFSRPRSRL